MSRRQVAIVSSRIGRRWDQRAGWLRLFKHAVGRLSAADDALRFGTGSTCAPFLRRAAQLFGFATVELPSAPSPSRPAADADYFHPAAGHAAVPSGPATESSSDAQAILGADLVIAIHVRPGGRIETLLRERLRETPSSAGSVLICLGAHGNSRCLANKLIELGAVGLVVLGGAATEWDGQAATAEAAETAEAATPGLRDECSATPRWTAWPRETAFLLHCTRACPGPWPDQSLDAYVDELLLETAPRDHSALGSLSRILLQQRVRASAAGIRGGYAVVSFTAMSIDELSARRVYRSHRHRWDFEPYGIGIAAGALSELGARPVVYGEPSDWARLPADERFRFQRSRTRSPQPIDWRPEQEWRHPGDVLLDRFASDQAIVFVPTLADARRISAGTRFPIHVLEATHSATDNSPSTRPP